MNCGACKFFNENRCLRFPPSPTQYGEAVYPRVTENYPICGEFAEIVPATTATPYQTEIKTISKKRDKNTINKREGNEK